jgi:hypothetical protein
MQEKCNPAISIEVECKRCRENWTLNPNKWRNLSTVNKTGKKRIVCPYCNCKMLLNIKQTKELMKQRKNFNKILSIRNFRRPIAEGGNYC